MRDLGSRDLIVLLGELRADLTRLANAVERGQWLEEYKYLTQEADVMGLLGSRELVFSLRNRLWP